jgi:DNA-binding transcriptional MerR regulator
MRIGQLAHAAGISVDALRYYERIGLIPRPHRTPAGYREFPDGAVNRVRVIRNAVQLGFPLREIVRVLSVRDQGGTPCRQVRDYAEGLVSKLDARITEMRAEKRALAAMIRDWDERLARAGPNARAHLLEQPAPATRAPRLNEVALRRRR